MGKVKKQNPDQKLLVQNKKARHDFEILESFEVGLVLRGSEVKSLRDHKASLQESYIKIEDGEAFWVKGHIDEYPQARTFNHRPTRTRKLLMRKPQIRKLHAKVREKGLTLIPIRIYLNERNLIKMEIGLAKGKTKGDKRQAEKKKIAKREMRDL